MRHGKKINHLGRQASHRKAMLSNMATSLIMEKRISTTVAKAKALKKYVEPLITKSKDDTTHSRRTVFSYLQNKESVTVLFNEVSPKVADRPGGYTRIIKVGNRLGDNADMCIIELVDYNELMLKDAKAGKAKSSTRRSRRGGSSKATAEAAPKAEAKAEAAPAAEAKTEEAPKAEAAPEAEAPATEEKKDSNTEDSNEESK